MKKAKMRAIPHPTSEQIKAARESAGLTRTQAANLIGYTRQAWANWERGTRKMRASLFGEFERSVEPAYTPKRAKKK